jgi:glutamate-1-semialdehyde 2,1-aminomutase
MRVLWNFHSCSEIESMDNGAISNSEIEARYRQRTVKSASRAASAREIFPSGIVHDSRKTDPWPIYVERAKGARKWDIDGHEYIDYYGGHGALILGHGHPKVLEAVHAQLELGTHYGACHELEMQWGELIKRMVPCAQRLRFHSSGTEANLMALRLARAYTGKSKVVRFQGHFHGWQDHVAFGVDSHHDGSATPGVLAEIADNIILADSQDLTGTTALLESRDDIAAVILESTGGSFGAIPLPDGFLQTLRKVTTAQNIILIFDEVVTGFRVSPGGSQSFYQVTPDLASFAKIVAGGMPGACVAGRKDLLDQLDFEVTATTGKEKIGHQGTYNANPVCAAAGIAALEVIESENICAAASATAGAIRDGINRVFADESIPWYCYGAHSGFYIFTDPEGAVSSHDDFDPGDWSLASIKRSAKKTVLKKFRLALLNAGVDISSKPGGIVSAVHDEHDVAQTIDAVRDAVRALRAEGEV